MKHHETQVRRIWNCAEEEIALEAMERQLQEAVKCVSAAQEVQRASEGVYSFARQMERKILATGLLRVWQMRCECKFKLADEALKLMQKYLRALHETERQAADGGLSQEETFVWLERVARAHEATQPEVQPRLWRGL